MEKAKDELEQALRAFFGYEEFRPPQRDIIRNILNKRDVIGILPTGTGKSLCYQLPAVLFGNLTVVLSPLVALMKDQVDILNSRGIPAVSLNSQLTPKQMRERIEEIREGRYKILYLAPEKLFSEDFSEVFRELPIDHIAIDEAHCISQWGHDFRPKYKKIALALERLNPRPVLSAFTATANEGVVEDIRSLLKLREPVLFRTSFDRPNLFIDVRLYEDKTKYVLSFLRDTLKPEGGRKELGIVYCSTRGDAERLHKKLLEEGFRSGLYHAGLTKKERIQVQEDFFGDRFQVLVATNAFGMGLDKEDITFIVHFSMPGSLESYYQEIGRGGRNGEPCRCVLLFGLKDVQVNQALGQQRVYFKWRLDQKREWLEEMLAFTHSKGCYRQFILDHFGEVSEPCGNCGNCLAPGVERDQTEDARKILSAVYHMKGLYGKATLSGVLRGSRNARIREKALDRLSVYGIMKDRSEAYIQTLLMDLILQGFLERQSHGLEERLQITSAGAGLLKGERRLVQRVRIEG